MKTIIAQQIRALRRAAGMSQEQLADACGVSVQAVSKWECAQSYPDIELLVQAWATIHEEELYAAWNNAIQQIPFGKIAPLQ